MSIRKMDDTNLFKVQPVNNKRGPIIIIEDDLDDKELLEEIFAKLEVKNKLVFFSDGNQAITYLRETSVDPFVILSDVNMPLMNGYELVAEIHNDESLLIRCIPFVFLTTSSNRRAVIAAYKAHAQGFFIKPTSFTELEKLIKSILEYWRNGISPGDFL